MKSIQGSGAVAAVSATAVILILTAALVVLKPVGVVPDSPQGSAPASSGETIDLQETTASNEALAANEQRAAVSRVTGWMPYWATTASLNAATNNANIMKEVSPFWFQIVEGRKGPEVKPYDSVADPAKRTEIRDQLSAKRIKVIPSIVDDSPARYLATQLKGPKKRAALVQQISSLVRSEGYAGIDLDWENFAFKDGSSTWNATRPAWVAFVRQLSNELKKHRKVVTVATPPIYSRDYAPGSGYWVYDWENIAPYIHRLRVMTYDYSFDKAGPIGPLDWATEIMTFAKTVVPPKKLQMGAPAYGRNWVTNVNGTCPAGTPLNRTYLSMQGAEDLAATRRATPQWDSQSAEATYTYQLSYGTGTQTCTVTRTVWYPTPKSLTERSRAARQLGINGIAIWSLNDVSPQGWAALQAG